MITKAACLIAVELYTDGIVQEVMRVILTLVIHYAEMDSESV